MAQSTTWRNMNANSAMVLLGDSKPWGGFSNLSPINNAKVKSVSVGEGATFDTAQLTMTDADFGDGMIPYSPIKIIAIAGTGVNATQVTIFRGFVVRNLGRIDSGTEEVTIECSGYKWYLSRVSKIQGKIYVNDGSDNGPASTGSGLSIGSKKLTFEKFRMRNEAENPNNQGNLVRIETCVFNQGGIPDCATLTHANTQVVFYKPKVQYEELEGVASSHSVPVDWNGHLWSWATILGHIERYWISPYTGAQGKVEISSLDMVNIASKTSGNVPIDFSLEGMNPLAAIDAVVRALPGRWYWYMDYNQFFAVKIRIKQHGNSNNKVVNLRMCPKESANHICQVNSNVESADFTEDATASVKYVTALGGNVKLVTTVKATPLWPTYNGNDFIDDIDFEAWKKYAYQSDDAAKMQMEEEKPDLIARYKKIYKEYGIPLRGQDFKSSIVDLNNLEITGDMYSEYRDYEKDILNWFFRDGHIIRQVQPPNFNRYSDSVKVFMHDKLGSGFFKKSDGTSIIKEFKNQDAVAATSLDDQGKVDMQWVNPETSGDSYEYDDKNGIIRFATPQFLRQVTLGADDQTADLQSISRFSFDGNDKSAEGRNPAYTREDAQAALDGDTPANPETISTPQSTFKAESRDVYLTGTFSSDVPTVAGKRAIGIFDATGGAPFTEHLDQGDNSLIIHKGAFYPTNWDNKEDTLVYNTDTIDGHVTGSRIIKAERFSNYNLFIGSGGEEVKRAVEAFVQNYEQIVKTANITMPYMETGYTIGDILYNIQNTNYTDLRMTLSEVQYNAEGDSDQYKTSYQFSNQSAASPGRPNTVSNKRDQVEALLGIRIPYNFRI